jgi:Leucine-rich repeat (LRR) protein/predicted Ser/Thr protein kinase
MPAPDVPQPATDATSPPSARSDADETYTLGVAETGDTPPAFGPPAEPGEVGTLGPYRLLKELGRGGMGAVYAALDTRLERRLAMKVMLPKFAADASSRERFLREARAAARIKHDNVVTVYEADERQGVPYIAMEFLEGYPLDQYLAKKGNPSIPQVLRIGAETAAGLAAAHKFGLVHRDIKPGNLWLEAPNGRVKVLDFGLAKPMDAEVEITRSGAVVGTPAYMSPEQARGEKVDHRSDLFSLGAVLYRLCTGRLPFQGPTTMAVLMSLGMDEPPPARELNPTVPESLAALIHQLLAKKPEARPQSADDVVKRIRSIADELATPVAMAVPVPDEPPVVYAPMFVTAVPEANPFADIDATEPATATAEPSAVAPLPSRRNPAGMNPWMYAGLAVLIAGLALGGTVLFLNQREKPEAEADPPEDPGPPVKGKGPSGTIPVALGADRKTAEWVLSVGGTVRVNGNSGDIKAVNDFPKGQFTLTTVNLNGVGGVTDKSLDNLKGLKRLTHLHLHQAGVTDAGLSALVLFPGLMTLDLSHTKVTDGGLVHLNGLKELTQLSLSFTPVTDAGMEHLAGLTALERLDLRSTAITGTGLIHLKSCKGLTGIDLAGAQFTDAGLAHLKAFTELNNLRLESTQVTDGGLVHLADLKKLTHLSMTFTKISDAGLAHLKECKSFTDVYLDKTAVTDAGLLHFKDCKNLSNLRLNDTTVTDAGLAHLKEAKGLTYLDLKGTKVTAKGLDDFHAAVPGCVIVHDGGTIPAVDVDRKAAEWVLSLGGQSFVGVTAAEALVNNQEHLPKQPFKLNAAWLASSQATDDSLKRLSKCQSLVSVRFDGSSITDKGLVHLRDCPLQVFQAGGGNAIGDEGIRELAAHTQLREIILDGSTVTDIGVKLLTGLPDLRTLTLNNSKITDAGLVHLASCQKLSALHLNVSMIGDVGLAHLKALKSMKNLSLIRTQITDSGLVHLKDCKGLEHLDVRGTKVTPKALAEYHAAMPGCKIEHDGGTIEPIDVDRKAAEWVLSLGGKVWVNGDGPDIEGVERLPKSGFVLSHVNLIGKRMVDLDQIKWCRGLTILHLEDSDVKDAALARVKNLTSLKTLALAGTSVTDASLDILTGFTNLTILNVRKTKLTTEGVKKLAAALPGCKIEHDGGTIEPKK